MKLVTDVIDVEDLQGFSMPGVRIISDYVLENLSKIHHVVVDLYTKIMTDYHQELNITVYDDDISWMIMAGNLSLRLKSVIFYKVEYAMTEDHVSKEVSKLVEEWLVRISLPAKDRNRYLSNDEIALRLVQLRKH